MSGTKHGTKLGERNKKCVVLLLWVSLSWWTDQLLKVLRALGMKEVIFSTSPHSLSAAYTAASTDVRAAACTAAVVLLLLPALLPPLVAGLLLILPLVAGLLLILLPRLLALLPLLQLLWAQLPLRHCWLFQKKTHTP